MSIPLPCWCGGDEASRVFKARSERGELFSYVQCHRCGMLSLYPRPTQEQLHAAYESDYYGGTRRKFIPPVAALVKRFQSGRARLVARHFRGSKNRKILDVGCGNGGFLEQMQERGFTIEGTEWTARSAARVPEGIPVRVGDLLDLALPREHYDAVSLWHVFEHLDDPAATLWMIHEILRPGGLLFLSLPNQSSWQARLSGPHWFHLDPPRHLHGFGRETLRLLARSQHFRPLYITTWSLEQNPFGVIQSALNLLGFPRERAYSTLKGVQKRSAGSKAIDLALVGALAVPALVFSVAEAISFNGGTMTLVLKRK